MCMPNTPNFHPCTYDLRKKERLPDHLRLWSEVGLRSGLKRMKLVVPILAARKAQEIGSIENDLTTMQSLPYSDTLLSNEQGRLIIALWEAVQTWLELEELKETGWSTLLAENYSRQIRPPTNSPAKYFPSISKHGTLQTRLRHNTAGYCVPCRSHDSL